MPVLGVLRRAAPVETPSRHLGLVPVAERRGDAVAAVAAMGELVRRGCDLAALLALARGASDLGGEPWTAYGLRPCPQSPDGLDSPAPPAIETRGSGGGALGYGKGRAGEQSRRRRPVVAVAGGPAFTFSYAEHAELLTAAGADVVTFDPLRDEQLPDGTDGLVIGGGFPEVYAPELSANEPLRKAVGDLARSGAPVAAECAGLLYLARSLDGREMCGVLDAEARMGERLTLGYRDAVAVTDSCLAAAGTRLRGHEFHRTAVEPGAGPAPAWGMHRPERRVEGFVQQGVHASYLHTHWAAEPGIARRFVERCTR